MARDLRRHMSDSADSFGKRVLKCVDEMGHLWLPLQRRYDAVVVVSAMADHVGTALRILLRRKACDASDARRLIERIESRAFWRSRQGDSLAKGYCGARGPGSLPDKP
jgi:hypothetical protein